MFARLVHQITHSRFGLAHAAQRRAALIQTVEQEQRTAVACDALQRCQRLLEPKRSAVLEIAGK